MIHDFVIESESREASAGMDEETLRREFPSVRVRHGDLAPDERLRALRMEEWRDPRAELHVFDERVETEKGSELFLVADGGRSAGVALQMLTRYQWLVGRRNASSATSLFDRVLDRHRALHDLAKPLVRADFVHALDTWQWTLRLDPAAGFALQAAALFHDVERLVSEPDARVEHLADDYPAFKRAHAGAGARMVRELLVDLGAPAFIVDRVAALVAAHEEPGGDPELALLNDADSLSFFSRNSDGFLRYYGPEHTRAKVQFTLGRLRPAALARIRTLRVRPEIARCVARALAASRSAETRQEE